MMRLRSAFATYTTAWKTPGIQGIAPGVEDAMEHLKEVLATQLDCEPEEVRLLTPSISHPVPGVVLIVAVGEREETDVPARLRVVDDRPETIQMDLKFTRGVSHN